MKKRRILIGAALALCAVIAGFWLWWRGETTLNEVCPAVATGSYEATLFEPVTCGAGDYGTPVSEEMLRRILPKVRLRRRAATRMEPPVAFHLRLTENGVTYSLVLGDDGSVTVARLDDLEGTRTFWTDSSGRLFPQLYALHLQNGGAEPYTYRDYDE